MIKFIKHLVIFVLALVLQTTLASWISVRGIEPDFVLIFVVVMAISHGPVSGMLWGFFAGFSEDIYSPVEWLGAQAVAFTCVGFGVGQLEEKFLRLNLATKVALLGVAFAVNDLIYFLLVDVAKENLGNFLLTTTLPEGVYTVFFGILLFHLLNRFDGEHRHA